MRIAAILVYCVSFASAQQPAKTLTTTPPTAGTAPKATPPQYSPFRPPGIAVDFKVTAGEIRFEAGKAVSSDATIVKLAVGDSDIELVTDKVVTEGKNFVINTKKYGKMRVVFDDSFGATLWVTPSQRRELLKLASTNARPRWQIAH